MTRVLAELLSAAQPRFGMTIRELERAAGHPSADIRLATEVLQRARAKIKELGLDPQDTTERELYGALMVRLDRDEALVRQALGVDDSAPADIVLAAIQQFIGKLDLTHKTFAMKPSVAKRLLKKLPPKKAMKQLHYRSVDSMIKHEPVTQIYVAAFLCEPLAWRKKFLELYESLQPNDFESRAVAILMPTTARWTELASRASEQQRHNIIVVKELGTVVVLPISKPLPGLALTSFVLLTNALNDIASMGSYLKLQQVKPAFGSIVRKAVEHEPMTSAQLVDRPVPWRVVHQYYARFKNAYNPVIFEPHVQPADLRWVHPEALLSQLHPALSFWHDTRYTAFKTGSALVSMNIFDAAISRCNNLVFADRAVQFVRQHLWHELMVRYLNQENVERAIIGELDLQPEFLRIDE